MVSLSALLSEARKLGVSVHLAHLDEPFLGIYDRDAARIYVQLGLPMAETKATIAHEIGHAHHGHLCSTGRNERAADKVAARLLVDVDDYMRAENIDSHPSAIADELGVTEQVVRDFQTYWLEGRGVRTFGSSRR